MKNLKIFAKTIDEKAKQQIDLLLEQDAFKDCVVRIMPDVHAGAGCVIGFTGNLGDKIIPNIVGVDIGCGMLTVKLGKISVDYEKLDNVIRTTVPSGMNVHDVPMCNVEAMDLNCVGSLKNIDWLNASMGTLGGGNHFIEIDEDRNLNKYLVIHTGSRNLGKQVAEIYQNKAVKHCQSNPTDRAALIAQYKAEGRASEIQAALKACTFARIPKDLSYLEGEDAAEYLHDMRICQCFATSNRFAIASAIANGMGWGNVLDNSFETIHNYIDDKGMVRKGAISAKEGEQVLIPLNMRDGCILGIGKGNADWNYSAPHGAGRIMSRMEARTKINLEEFQNSMAGIYTTSAVAETIDEAPQAYKPMEDIIDIVSETVDVVKILKPRYNFKASEAL